MRVHVDEARGHQLAARVDLFLALACDLADLGDAPVADRDIRLVEIAALAVGNAAAADHEVRSIGHGASSRL